MGGVKLIAIEAKCFDFVLEDESTFFRCQITERGRGFIKSLFLGRDAAYWLMSTFRDLALAAAPTFIRRSEGEGKVFCVFRGRNNRGRYVLVTEFFGNGRRSTIIIPEGNAGGGWHLFGKALSEILLLKRPRKKEEHGKQFSSTRQFAVVSGKSYSDAVRGGSSIREAHNGPVSVAKSVLFSKKGALGPTQSLSNGPLCRLRVEVNYDGKRLVKWVSESPKVVKKQVGPAFPRLRPKRSVFSRLGPLSNANQPSSSLGPLHNPRSSKVKIKQIWRPKANQTQLNTKDPSLDHPLSPRPQQANSTQLGKRKVSYTCGKSHGGGDKCFCTS